MSDIMKKFLFMLLVINILMILCGCSTMQFSQIEESSSLDYSSIFDVSEDVDSDYNYDEEYIASPSYDIVFENNKILFEGSNAIITDNVITIKTAGIYNISGSISNGSIIVDIYKKDSIVLKLNNADITCEKTAPIIGLSVGQMTIELVEGSQNYLTDCKNYTYNTTQLEDVGACIYSKGDLILKGDGDLTINAKMNNGIHSKDGLTILSGNYNISAVNNAIKGKDYVAIKDGNFELKTETGDGIQSDNDTDTDKGFVLVQDGNFIINAQNDGIQAIQEIQILDGNFTIKTNYSNSNAVSTQSYKGIKSTNLVTINGGTIVINSADDSIHSDNNIVINGGKITISSSDDGIHAEKNLTINGGEINITRSYEGLEALTIEINDGTIHLISSDDGINAAGGDQISQGNGPGFPNTSQSNASLYIRGGYVYVDSSGDGLDANGSVEMSGGTVIVFGPTNSGNATLDYDKTFTITGGLLIACGSSGMAQNVSNSSTQYTVMINLSTAISNNQCFKIESENGEEVVVISPPKRISSIIISSSKFAKGTYKLYTGGQYSGNIVDGVGIDGSYSGGSTLVSFIISKIITTSGNSGGDGNRPW